MAVSKKITRKVEITKKVIVSKPVKVEEVVEEIQSNDKVSEKTSERRRVCYFCQNKKTPSYTDMATLKRHVNERAKIVPALKSGVCSRHQRVITRGIKYARHLALLPFTPKV